MPNEAKLLYDALLYENGHLRRTQHILKVYGLAKMLGELENLPTHEQENLRAAAILHDIAIKFCKEKYDDGCPANQRKEVPALARKFLTACGYAEEDLPRITKMIVLHHCYDKIDARICSFSLKPTSLRAARKKMILLPTRKPCGDCLNPLRVSPCSTRL